MPRPRDRPCRLDEVLRLFWMLCVSRTSFDLQPGDHPLGDNAGVGGE